MYTISIDFVGTKIKGKGATPLEALQSMKKPVKIISKGVMTISDGKNKKEMLFMPAKMKRIFFPSAQPVLIKWLAAGLK